MDDTVNNARNDLFEAQERLRELQKPMNTLFQCLAAVARYTVIGYCTWCSDNNRPEGPSRDNPNHVEGLVWEKWWNEARSSMETAYDTMRPFNRPDKHGFMTGELQA